MTRRSRPSNPPTDDGAPDPQEASSQEAPHEALLQQIQRFTPEDWQGKKVYLYRVWPIIDRKGDDHFIARLAEVFDLDFIMKNWGSGRYQLRLNGARGETIASQVVSIHNPSYPPQVDPLEVVAGEPRNATYYQVWGPRAAKSEPSGAAGDSAAVQELSKLAGKVLDQRAGAPAPQSDAISDATKDLLLGMSKGRDELAEKLATLAGGSGADPIAALDRAVELIKKLQPENGKAAASDPLAALDRAVELVKKLQPAAPAQLQKNPVEQVTEMVDLYSKLKDTFGSGVASDGTGNLASVAAIVHDAAELLKNPLTIAAQVLASKARPAPSGQPGPDQPPAGPPVEPAANGNPPTASPQADTQSFVQFVEQITPAMIAKLESGAPGADFAGWIYEGWPDILARLQTLSHPGLPGLSGAPVIIQFYRSTPHWPRIALHEARFAEFIAEFCKWKPADDDEPDASKDGDGEAEDGEVERIEA